MDQSEQNEVKASFMLKKPLYIPNIQMGEIFNQIFQYKITFYGGWQNSTQFDDR